MRVYAERLQVVAEECLVAEHPRGFGRSQSQFKPWHYLPVLEHKPGALRDGAPFQHWALPAAFRQRYERLRKQPGGDAACVALLVAGREHGLELLDVACAMALAQETVSAAVVLNHLHRLLSPPQPDPRPVPERWRLTREPTADGARYDRRRSPERRHAH